MTNCGRMEERTTPGTCRGRGFFPAGLPDSCLLLGPESAGFRVGHRDAEVQGPQYLGVYHIPWCRELGSPGLRDTFGETDGQAVQASETALGEGKREWGRAVRHPLWLRQGHLEQPQSLSYPLLLLLQRPNLGRFSCGTVFGTRSKGSVTLDVVITALLLASCMGLGLCVPRDAVRTATSLKLPLSFLSFCRISYFVLFCFSLPLLETPHRAL